MNRQVTNLVFEEGIAQKGLIIRLLVLPEGISGTLGTLEYIYTKIGLDVYLSLMSQYYPAYIANSFMEISRRITEEEYNFIVDKTHKMGFSNGWIQPFDGDFDDRFAGENFLSNI